MEQYIAKNATVVGAVTLGDRVSIWYGAVLRGDHGAIVIGDGTNIQDNCVVHEKTTIGRNCTVGHGAIVHGCTIGDNTTVGMGAIVLTGAVIGENCVIGAGAVVTGKMVAPAGSVLLGSPAKVVKQASAEMIAGNAESARFYMDIASKTLK
jgi:carbonic anhydrase/acetyltransferase-like protein (isoleucine patch superfamily)